MNRSLLAEFCAMLFCLFGLALVFIAFGAPWWIRYPVVGLVGWHWSGFWRWLTHATVRVR